MHLDRTLAVTLRQFYLIRGSLSRALPLFAWVAVDMVLWGFITRYLNTFASSGFNFIPAMLGAVLLWDFLTRIMQGVTTAFFEDVWSRNFLNIFATPLTITEYLGGLILTSMATSIVGLLVMIFLATVVFGLSFAVYGVLIVPFMLVLFLFGIALGIISSALVLRLGPAAEWFIWPIPALLSPFVGVFYPLTTLPGWMQAISRGLPPSYVFENLRAILSGGVASGTSLIWGTGLAVLYVILAAWIFTRTYRYAVRTGLFARYSAESVA
jgi:ABC-2 type transport system permease protein